MWILDLTYFIKHDRCKSSTPCLIASSQWRVQRLVTLEYVGIVPVEFPLTEEFQGAITNFGIPNRIYFHWVSCYCYCPINLQHTPREYTQLEFYRSTTYARKPFIACWGSGLGGCMFQKVCWNNLRYSATIPRPFQGWILKPANVSHGTSSANGRTLRTKILKGEACGRRIRLPIKPFCVSTTSVWAGL